MFLIFLGFTTVITSKVLDAKDKERQQTAENLATLAKQEIDLAFKVADGYNRTFDLPGRVDGNVYSIEILDGREVVVNYVDKEYVLFLQDSVLGNLTAGRNHIRKENGQISVNT